MGGRREGAYKAKTSSKTRRSEQEGDGQKSSGKPTSDPFVSDSVLTVEGKEGFILRGGVGEPLIATFGLDMVCDEVREESSLPIL